jgi:hypothetical protein
LTPRLLDEAVEFLNAYCELIEALMRDWTTNILIADRQGLMGGG